MRRSVIRRKLRRVDRALDKAIDAAEIPGAVVLAEMRRDGELLEHASVLTPSLDFRALRHFPDHTLLLYRNTNANRYLQHTYLIAKWKSLPQL